jgi:hypothetical protein
VIEAEFARRTSFAAVLATVSISRENVTTIELNSLSRDSIEGQQTNDSRDLHLEVNGSDKFVVRTSEPRFCLGDFPPAFEIEGEVLALVDCNHLREVLEQEAERSTHRDDLDCHVKSVEDQDTTVEGMTIG